MKHLFIIFTISILAFFSSTELEAQWNSHNIDSTIQLNACHFVDQNTGWTVGLFGAIHKTIDGGISWQNQSISNTFFLNGVHFANVNVGWAVGLFGVVAKTTNSGATWTNQLSLTTNDLLRVQFVSTSTGWAIGRGGTIIKSITGGTFWSSQTSGVTNDLTGMHFPSSTVGYVVGLGGVILKTTNAGTTWSSLSSGTTSNLLGVNFVNTNLGFAVGANGLILKTIDGGATWSTLTSGTANQLTGVHFVDANNGRVIGTLGTILRTTNGGVTWLSEYNDLSSQFTDIHFVNALNGWAVGLAGRIVKYNYQTLQAPILQSPANNSSGFALSDTLKWSPVVNASSYRIQISNDSVFSNLLINSVVNSNSFVSNNLQPSTAYFWRVCSKSLTDSSAWSSVWKFNSFGPITQTIPLKSGWNLVSLNVIPIDTSFSSVLSSISSFVILKSIEGKVYSPPFSNGINFWESTKAYYIYCSQNDTLAVSGFPINPQSLSIKFSRNGWHWIPYLRNNSMTPLVALLSISGNYDHIKSTDGKVFKINNQNTLQSLNPGEGYFINITSTTLDLIYPPN